MHMTRFIVGLLATAAIPATVWALDDAPAAPPGANIKDCVTHIKIQAHNLTAKEAFDEIAKQAHVEFGENGNVFCNMNRRNFPGHEVKTTIDVDLTGRPFWLAVFDICDQCDASIQPGFNNNDQRIMLSNAGGQHGKPTTFERDGFVVQALSFNRQQSINYANVTQSMGSNFKTIS